MKVYLKEPNTNTIIEFQNEASIGVVFRDWQVATEEEIIAYLLNNEKIRKNSSINPEWT